jgi:type II secretory pathway component PulC
LDLDNLKNELERINDRVAPRKFHYNITTLDPADLTKSINAKLAASPLTRNLKFEIKNKTAVIKGVVAASAEERTIVVVRNLTNNLMSSYPVVVDIATDPKINFQVSSVMMGGQGTAAILTLRGKSEAFKVGDEVFGLGELLEIRKDGVIVSSKSKELFVPVN